MKTILSLRDVTVAFGPGAAAVDHVSLELEAQRRTVLIGETGSGKSVLLLSILGLLPSEAWITGEVLYQGQDLLCTDPHTLQKLRGQHIAYIPQGSGNGMNPLMRVGFQVGEPLMEHRGLTKKEAVAQSVHLLRRFHIGREEDRVRDYPHTFSGGMRQRAMVAMGISADPEVLLADEPTKGLDPSRIAMVAECFQSLEGKTLLCVTHDIAFARRIGHRIAVMYAAQCVEIADKDDFFAHPLHPYAQAMLAALPENGLECRAGFAPSHDSYGESGCRFAQRCPWRSEKCQKMPPLFQCQGHQVRCWKYES